MSVSPWPAERAWRWYREQPWLVGCNFIPSTASNQLEMWQAETFDPETIDRELGWAAGIGMNAVRVYLHDIAFRVDGAGFLERVERFLDLAERHGVRTMFVLFDSVWNPFPKPGPQPEPRPRVHNAGWLQSPGREILSDPTRHHELEPYVSAVVGRFREDPRVLVWDVVNEPENPNLVSYGSEEPEDKDSLVLSLLEKAYGWTRAADPAQPLTSGVWQGDWRDPAALSPVNEFLLTRSDVVSFHCYLAAERMRKFIAGLESYGRPLVCTEYMARTLGSTFEEVLPVLAEKRVGAFCWGLVAGRTQTIYSWDSWLRDYDSEPDPWFHDVFRSGGVPYREEEVRVIRACAQAVNGPPSEGAAG